MKITNVKDMKGECSVAKVRGKTRHLFDLAFTLAWTGTCQDGARTCAGSLAYPDVSPDGDWDAICSVSAAPKTNSSLVKFRRRPCLRKQRCGNQE